MQARKKLQREGLLPMKPRVIPGPRKGRPRAHSSLLILEHPYREQSRYGGKGRKR